MEELIRLADLIKQKNEVESEIAKIIKRPAVIDHVGEFIASKIFDITLNGSASSKGFDGYFYKGKLVGKSVNIKFYTKNEGFLDITPAFSPDYYLVLTGETVSAASKGTVKPWEISHVFLFQSAGLMGKLKKRKVKIGTATSLIRDLWHQAEIFPESNNGDYKISSTQMEMLNLFR